MQEMCLFTYVREYWILCLSMKMSYYKLVTISHWYLAIYSKATLLCGKQDFVIWKAKVSSAQSSGGYHPWAETQL